MSPPEDAMANMDDGNEKAWKRFDRRPHVWP